ncbi:MAG: glycoside hydrolase family 16 protein [Prolixibacteraceae bacterium]|nr:glycoside hydrolase family 16 protein [Prolixibacteraceae bacterium]
MKLIIKYIFIFSIRKNFKILNLILLFNFIFVQLNAQTLCEGTAAAYTYSFNQCDNNPWVLVFEDDFEGNSLDLSKWSIISGIARDPFFEIQKAWHKAENISVGNGILKIISKKETLLNQCCDIWVDGSTHTICSDYDYSTGEIWTKKEFPFGKIEARIKIPKGMGFFPAFWLWGGDPVYNEIDIFEFLENDFCKHKMNVIFDYDGDGERSHCPTNYNGPDFSLSYHIFTLIWDSNKIEWYVDGTLKRTDYRRYTQLGQATGCNINAYTPYVLNTIFPVNTMAIILNTAIQNGLYTPNSTTPFPSQMEVDWVRYYKRSSCDNISITNASQFALSDDIFNVIIGNNVSINCNYTVRSIQQLKIIAKNETYLGPGFNTEVGAVFEVETDTNICN